MQADSGEFQRNQQLVEALGQCGQYLRSTANMLDQYVTFIQNMPHASISPPVQNMFQMFAPPGQPAGGLVLTAANGSPTPAPVPVQAPTRTRKRRVADSVGDNAEPEFDENGKKKRKRAAPGEKKVKDVNAPKRPPSAYLLFQNEVRREMQERFPDHPYREVLTKISERWSQMSDAEKKYYNDVTNESRAKFEVAKAAYDTSLAAAAPSTGTAATPAASAAVPVAGPTVPSVPSVPPVAVTVAPAPAPAPEPSDSDKEEDSEVSSVAAVSAVVAQSPSSDDSSSSSESSSSDDEDAAPAPQPATKKDEKSALKKGKAPPPKPAASVKAEKEKERKRFTKSKKDATA